MTSNDETPLENAEIALLGAGFNRLSKEHKENILAKAEALKFAEEAQACETNPAAEALMAAALPANSGNAGGVCHFPPR